MTEKVIDAEALTAEAERGEITTKYEKSHQKTGEQFLLSRFYSS